MEVTMNTPADETLTGVDLPPRGHYAAVNSLNLYYPRHVRKVSVWIQKLHPL